MWDGLTFCHGFVVGGHLKQHIRIFVQGIAHMAGLAASDTSPAQAREQDVDE